jgi:hypothetical protein
MSRVRISSPALSLYSSGSSLGEPAFLSKVIKKVITKARTLNHVRRHFGTVSTRFSANLSQPLQQRFHTIDHHDGCCVFAVGIPLPLWLNNALNKVKILGVPLEVPFLFAAGTGVYKAFDKSVEVFWESLDEVLDELEE